jgi:hypothetical protein
LCGGADQSKDQKKSQKKTYPQSGSNTCFHGRFSSATAHGRRLIRTPFD